MSADATILLDAVEAAMIALYPDITVNVSKRGASAARLPLAGWVPGYPPTSFVVSCGEPETIDDASDFEYQTTRYWILIEYIKPALAPITGSVGKPTQVVEDPDVRDKRETIRLRFNRYSFAGIPNYVNVRMRTRPAYEVTGDNDQRLVVSGETFGMDLTNPRPVET